MNNKINNKKEENKIIKNNNINKKIEKDEENENIDQDEEAIIEQHKILFEQLQKDYAAKGIKFGIEDFYELLQNQAELDEEEEEEYEGF